MKNNFDFPDEVHYNTQMEENVQLRLQMRLQRIYVQREEGLLIILSNSINTG